MDSFFFPRFFSSDNGQHSPAVCSNSTLPHGFVGNDAKFLLHIVAA
jgi:hypothetical protein